MSPYTTKPQMSVPIRAPRWVSSRRLLEEKLQNLHKCTNLNHVKQLHAQIIKKDLHNDLYIAPKLVSSLSLCRQMELAIKVFNYIQDPNVHLYNTLIRACVQNSMNVHAFRVFFEMQKVGVFADNFTYPFLLKACSGQNWLKVVQMIHALIEKCGFLSDIFVPNALIDSYSKCGVAGVSAAKKLFMVLGERDTVTWNSMICGLVKSGELSEARRLFDEMPERDTISWNTMLDGYTKAGEMNSAFELFEKMPERNVVSWSTMIWGYSKDGDIETAKLFFDRMPFKNLVPWTIIISAFAERGMMKEAMRLYDEMEEFGLKPDDGTVISILAACAESGLLNLGMKVHASVERNMFKYSTNVSNALIDMYAKCGSLDKAMSVFNVTPKKDVVSWNAMLQGLAMHGHGEEALELFSRMKQEGFEPDKITFIGVLCACTHAGFIDEGVRYFYSMERDYGILPQVEHYGCMIDLLGRGGRLKEAFRVVHSMPFEPNAIIWGTLLGACRMHNAVELAEEALDHLVKLEPSNPGNYSMLSNIFAAAGDWDNVSNVRQLMRSTGIQKPSGASSIEVDNEVHEFTVYDRLHPKSEKIYEMIDTLVEDLNEASYVPKVPVDVGDGVIWDLEAWPPLLEWKKNRAKQERKRR
ncbi:pentatricopeptide repeat-containing protein At3g29230-like [Pistacia vera]|uniref:pentatricopeptide repeat-containing protein At3g29230-like n=1 Tax=Pistacia vera TaxID=55513 RepID=UPI0012639428|nr:pentatricopeptide repeat-containing protein At3g29230-like [Pistacia vera]